MKLISIFLGTTVYNRLLSLESRRFEELFIFIFFFTTQILIIVCFFHYAIPRLWNQLSLKSSYHWFKVSSVISWLFEFPILIRLMMITTRWLRMQLCRRYSWRLFCINYLSWCSMHLSWLKLELLLYILIRQLLLCLRCRPRFSSLSLIIFVKKRIRIQSLVSDEAPT